MIKINKSRNNSSYHLPSTYHMPGILQKYLIDAHSNLKDPYYGVITSIIQKRKLKLREVM